MVGRQTGDHPEDGGVATIHDLLFDRQVGDYRLFQVDHDLIGIDVGGDGTGVIVFGQKAIDNLIIIDEVHSIEEKLFKLLTERHRKPQRPTKQPDWARHNQAPRSFRRKK